MNFLKLAAILTLLTACQSGPHTSNSFRKPNSTKTTQLSVPTSDITSVITFPGSTSCTKRTYSQNRTRDGKPIYFFDCATAIPFSFQVKSSSLGIDKVFYAISEESYSYVPSKTDITINPGLETFNTEKEQEFSTYLSEVASGCYGNFINVTVEENGTEEQVQFAHRSYFGSARCKLVKAASSTQSFTVASFKTIAGKTKDIAAATIDHATKIVDSADAWQQNAREAAANRLKNLGEFIAPK